jgi:DnaJ-domain-containing protein 1
MPTAPKPNRFHGRAAGSQRPCAHPGCDQLGEFRAPGQRASGFAQSGFDGPGQYIWLCLDHIRAFNAAYDYFDGMSAEEILAAQHPVAGWAQESRAFSDRASVDQPPRWADFADPIDAISARFRAGVAERAPQPRADGVLLTPDQAKALKTLGLDQDADRKAIRRAYSDRLRRYHPDKNGGDRSFETKLQKAVDAYAALKTIK